MALDNNELAELAELEELDALEQQFAQSEQPSILNRLAQGISNNTKIQENQPSPLSKLISSTDAGDALKGAEQGLTLNSADEMGGGIQTALDAGMGGLHNMFPSIVGKSPTQVSKELAADGFTGDVGPTNSTDFYRQAQKENEAQYKETEERSPWLYTGGQIGGGLLGMLAGAGALKAGKGALMGANAGKEASKQTIKQILKEQGKLAATAQIGKKGAVMAALGAAEGGAMGSMGSEGAIIGATPEQKQQVADDTLTGIKTGGVLGFGVGVASDVAPMVANKAQKAVKNYIDDSPLLRQMGWARKQGAKGVNIASEAEQEGLGKGAALHTMEERDADSIVAKIQNADSSLGQAVGDSIDNTAAKGMTINVTEDISQNASTLSKFLYDNAEYMNDKTFIKRLQQMMPGSSVLNPVEAKGTLADLDKLINKLSRDPNYKTQFLQENALNLRKAIDVELKNSIPEYRHAAERFAQFRNSIPETILGSGKSSEANNVIFGKLRDKDTKLYEGVKRLIEGATRAGTSSSESKSVLVKLRTALKEIEASEAAQIRVGKLNPKDSVFAKMGQTPEEFIQTIKNNADASAAKHAALGMNPHAGVETTIKGAVTGIANTGRGTLMTSANKFGLYADRPIKAIKIAAAKPAELGRQLYNLTNDQYIKLSQKLHLDPSTTVYGKALEDAIKNSDMAKRNAVLFSMLQQKNIRNMLNEETEEE